MSWGNDAEEEACTGISIPRKKLRASFGGLGSRLIDFDGRSGEHGAKSFAASTCDTAAFVNVGDDLNIADADDADFDRNEDSLVSVNDALNYSCKS